MEFLLVKTTHLPVKSLGTLASGLLSRTYPGDFLVLRHVVVEVEGLAGVGEVVWLRVVHHVGVISEKRRVCISPLIKNISVEVYTSYESNLD